MTAAINPFLDLGYADRLYGTSERLTQRTSALREAKIAGRPVPEVIGDLLQPGPAATVLDVGCGRGSTTAHLARTWNPVTLIALDRSPALLTAARRTNCRVHYVGADFHALPMPTTSVDVIVAAFCLYHSTQPEHVLSEFQRCLRPGGHAILVTKSANSYSELDDLVAASGIDRDAVDRPSLYESFHSGNATEIAARHLRVGRVIHERHEFHFADADHLARYITTTPKYVLPPDTGTGDTAQCLLQAGESGLHMTSTVTYVLATQR